MEVHAQTPPVRRPFSHLSPERINSEVVAYVLEPGATKDYVWPTQGPPWPAWAARDPRGPAEPGGTAQAPGRPR